MNQQAAWKNSFYLHNLSARVERAQPDSRGRLSLRVFLTSLGGAADVPYANIS